MKRLDNYVNMLKGGAFKVEDKVKILYKDEYKDTTFTIELKNTETDTYFIKSGDIYIYNIVEGYIFKNPSNPPTMAEEVEHKGKIRYLKSHPPEIKPIVATKEQYDEEKKKGKPYWGFRSTFGKCKKKRRRKSKTRSRRFKGSNK